MCNFGDSNLATFNLYFYCLIETILILYLLEFSHPKKWKMWDPVMVTLLKMQAHYSQSIRENATPSSGTSPLASQLNMGCCLLR